MNWKTKKAELLVGLQAKWLELTLTTRKEVPMILYILGLSLITRGMYLAWHPFGWIFGGGALAWMAIQYEKTSSAQAEAERLEKLYNRSGKSPTPR